MAQAQRGDTVKVNYVAVLSDGTVLADRTEGEEPSVFTVGSGKSFPGLEEIVIGMEPGEFRRCEIAADEVFGKHTGDLDALLDTRKDLGHQTIVYNVWLLDPVV